MDYKYLILKLLGEIGDNDVVFLNQIYTIMKKHMEKQGGNVQIKGDKGQQDYMSWALRLAMAHPERAKEIYYLLLGFLGGGL